ncbi:hypothetical protein [Eubacterium ventriosum]|uniref:hypothetical protein n=1 Tax=Eubacterium ventriosum TaxID=39496 RepID=UPI003AB76591
MIKVRDILPLIYTNDIRLLDKDECEIYLIYQGRVSGLLSDDFLNQEVFSMWTEECIIDTINIQIETENCSE